MHNILNTVSYSSYCIAVLYYVIWLFQRLAQYHSSYVDRSNDMGM